MSGGGDRNITGEIAPYRRIVPYLMRGRNESSILFEHKLDLSRTLPYLEELNRQSPHKATIFHVVVWAVATVLHERPRLNRYIMGRRYFQRDGVILSFSIKKAFREDAPLVVVKMPFAPGEGLRDVLGRIHGEVNRGREEKPSYTDKELGFFLKLPRLVLDLALKLVRTLYYFGWLPRFFTEKDPFFASAFLTNLGSIGIDAVYHHLYEYGDIPFFIAIGRIRKEPVVAPDDSIAIRPVVTLKISYDERIEDGFYCAKAIQRMVELIENPAAADASGAGKAEAG